MMVGNEVQRDGFTVAGIAARTSNQAEASGEGAIPKLWERFYREDIASKISGRQGQAVYGLYTEYENGVHGEYTMLVGVAVEEGAEAGEGMVAKAVPAARYLVFTSDRGPIHRVVPETWQRIWAFFQEGTIERSYTGDFERYDERCLDPLNAVVDIYVAIR